MVIQASLLLEDKAILPDDPKRIISLTPSITDTLVMLGLLNRIVGVSSFCKTYVPMVKDKPIVGSYMNVNWDKINELDPDLILLGMGVQSKLIRMFLEKGYNVYSLPLPTSLPGILDNMLRISYITNTYEKGLNLYMSILARIEKLIENTPGETKAYVEIWVGEPRTIGQTSYIDDALRIIGVRNIYSSTREPYPKPNLKYVLESDPDYIIISSESARLNIERIIEEREWINLRAVREGKIIVLGIDRPLAHPSPRIIDVLEYLHKNIWG